MPAITPSSAPDPADDLTVNIGGLGQVQPIARGVFDSYVRDYADRLLDEASRYEERRRGDDSPIVEYTAQHIAEARRLVEDTGLPLPKRSPLYVFARLGSSLLNVTVGIIGGAAIADHSWVPTLAGLGIVAGGLAILLEFWNGRRKS